MNQGLFSCGVFRDLKKAFGTVHHNILLDKLNHYGFRGIMKDWFSSYLNNLMQSSTQIGPHISNKAKVVVFPRWSVIGPLLFYCMLMTYINARINLISFICSKMILISCFMLIKTQSLIKIKLIKLAIKTKLINENLNSLKMNYETSTNG